MAAKLSQPNFWRCTQYFQASYSDTREQEANFIENEAWLIFSANVYKSILTLNPEDLV